MKSYPQYKDSGIEWIGEVPEGWVVKKIKFLALNDNALFLDGDWIESKDIVFDDSQIRYITTGNIGEGKYKEQGVTYITEETFKKLNCTEIYPGDLLISRLNPPIGRCCIVPDLGNRIVTSVDNVVLRPDSNYLKPFLKYAMSNPKYYEYTSLIARGATMQRISRGLLGNVELPVAVDDVEQTAIANYLDRKTAELDRLVANKGRLIELYEEKKTAVINQAVTKGLVPDAPMKPSGIDWLGDLPAHWGVMKLKYLVAKIGSGVTPKGGASTYQLSGIPLLRSQNIHFDGLKLDDVAYISEEIHENMSGSKVHSGDVLLNITGASIGRCYFVDETLGEANVNQHVCIIRPTEAIETKFLYLVLRSGVGQIQISLEQTGGGREGLNFEALGSFEIPFMKDEDEQTTIVQHIETECSRLDAIIDKFKKQIDLLKEYRTTLIFEVVTGKIDVRDEVVQ